MVNSDLDYDEYKVKTNLQEKLKKSAPVKFGSLPNEKDTQNGMDNITEQVLDSLTDIVYTNQSEDNPFLIEAMSKVNTLQKDGKFNENYQKDTERMSPKQLSEILNEIRDQKMKVQVNNLRNLKLSNAEWKSLIDIAGSGDTIDVKNILVIWNAIRKHTWQIKINAYNPAGMHETCNYTEHILWDKKVCNNYINPYEKFCPLHKMLKTICEEEDKNLSLFPAIFNKFIIYVKPEYENAIIGKSPVTFEMSRKLMTIEYDNARR